MSDVDPIRAAAEVLDGAVHRTPVLTSSSLAEIAGGPVRLKAEHLQRTGSFKARGAYVRLARLTPDEAARGVVAASAGNHAQGVAWAARELGIDATVYMPSEAALPKIEATTSYGARIVLGGDSVDEALARAQAECGDRVFIHPFDHPDIVAGQGTVGLEILDDVPDVGTIVVPTGGGGLLAGIVQAIGDRRDIRVVGVQAERVAAYPASLAAGSPVAVTVSRTMADGIAVGKPGDVPFALVARSGAEIVTVTENALSRGVLALAERAKQVVEPSGAAGVSALLVGAIGDLDTTRPIVVVLSGGNVDPIVLRKVFRHGLAAAGRYLHLRVDLTDRPGALAALLAVLAETRADVVSVTHVRTGPGLGVDQTQIEVELVTNGAEHASHVLGRVAGAGYLARRR